MRSSVCIFTMTILASNSMAGPLPEERPLWPDLSERPNPIHYHGGEKSRENDPAPGSPSGLNRVFSQIDQPTYTLHVPDAESATGTGLVICPGGGYNDVWLDREGHDLALRLKKRGITSLVLKYRTNTSGKDGRPFSWDTYVPEAVADAHQALRILREQAETLKLDVERIGICGFSAGGHLALSAVLAEAPPESRANFAGLLYPWLEGGPPTAEPRAGLPPMFLMNAADDTVTPAHQCVAYYTKLVQAGVQAELHLYNKGGHGFDLGTGRGQAAALWPNNFAAWLEDVFPKKDE